MKKLLYLLVFAFAFNLIPVISDDNGVVWVKGYGVNKKNAVTDMTKNILSLEW